MSRVSNITWTKHQNDELRKAVRNFNAKISRLEKKHPELINALPEKVSVKQMKELIGTRKDLAREVNSLRRFTQRGAEKLVTVPDSKYNLKITKWQKKEMDIRLSVINKKRKERYDYISDIQATLRGKNLGYTVGDIGMGSVDENAVKPMKAFYPTMSRKDVNMRFKAMRLETQMAYWEKKEMQLKANVMKAIKANYGSMFPDETERILEAIEEMEFSEFYERFVSEPGEMEIVSPPPGANIDDVMRTNIDALQSTWVPNVKRGK